MPHLPIRWSFLKLNPKFIKSLTSLIDIIDTNSDMTESSTWFRVSIGVSLEVRVGFGPVVVCELEDAFKFCTRQIQELGLRMLLIRKEKEKKTDLHEKI